MLNIEKYKDEIKAEIGKDKTLGCAVNKLMGNTCDDYLQCNDCFLKSLDWLLQECKEPILSQEGKEFLKQLIAPFISNEIVSVCKNEDLQILRIDYKIGWTCYSKKVLGEKWDWFKNLNPEKLYTSKELKL